jgi:exodeoxyribonuclease-1
MSYVFYDLETTGLSSIYDVPLQSAFLQADADLNVMREITLRCRIPGHVVPSPDALMVTGVTPSMLEEQPMNHLEMMEQIGRILNDCKPAMLVGFNTIRFDDEVLRQNFFQTLLAPYQGSLTGHGRADVLTMLRAVAMFEPGAVVIPQDETGKRVVKLGAVCRANGIALSENDAHDALADVRATFALFRLLLERAPATMAVMLSHAKKSGPLGLIDSNEPLILGGVTRCVPVLPMIGVPGNANAWASIDLSQDPAAFLDMPAAGLIGLIRSNHSPVRQIKVNAQPILMRWDHGIHAVTDREPDAVYRERARMLWAHPTFTRHLVLAIEGQYADREPSPWPDGRLYEGGFISNADAAACIRWHELPWSERAGHASRHITDARLRSFAIRQCFLHDPALLSPEARARGEEWLRHRLLTQDDVPWLTIPGALARCDALAAATTYAQALASLGLIRTWLERRRDALGPAAALPSAWTTAAA